MPYAVAFIHFLELLFRHRLVLTVDDLIFCLIFMMTLQMDSEEPVLSAEPEELDGVLIKENKQDHAVAEVQR